MQDDKAIYTNLLEMMGFGLPLGEHRVGGSYISISGNGFNRICLYEYENTLQNTFSLIIFAGDTSKQAKDLFKHFSYTKALDLEESGWTVSNNFHFAWQRTKLPLSTSDNRIPIGEYIDFWQQALDEGFIRKYQREEFDMLLTKLLNANIMNAEDIDSFNNYFSIHNYQSVITCPGMINRISYSKDRLNENLEHLAAELKENITSLLEIYR